MDIEHRVLCAVVAEGSTHALTDAQITAEYFPTPVHAKVYKAILGHQTRYGRVPSAETLAAQFPGYTFDTPPEPIAVYLDRLVEQRNREVLAVGVVRAVEALEAGDLDASEGVLATTLRSLMRPSRRAAMLELLKSGDERLGQYRAYRESIEGLRGIPTGFPTVDRATQGLQPGQLVVLGGLPKGGKTTVLSAITRYAYEDAYANGSELVPLLYTIEMGVMEIAERLDASFAGIDVQKLRSGTLNQAEWIRLERAIARVGGMASFHIHKGIAHQATITQIAASIERNRPDLLAVDGIYLMRDELTGDVGTPQAITSLTQSFKRLADTWAIPVIITSQLLRSKVDRKKGADGGSFGWASSFEMDADIAMALDPTDDDAVKLLKIVASRNCPNVQSHIRIDWSRGACEELAQSPFEATTGGTSATSRW